MNTIRLRFIKFTILLAVLAAFAMAGVATAQTGEACSEHTGTFGTGSPVGLNSTRADGMVTLAWRGPGMFYGDQRANCTWRTAADFSAAQTNSNPYRSPSLSYTVERRSPGSDDYALMVTMSHIYDSAGLTVREWQGWTDSAPPDGRVIYRVRAIHGSQQTHYASVVVQIGPVQEATPQPEATPAEPEPPSAVLCFYQWNGEIRSMALKECSVETLIENWPTTKDE